VNSLPLILTVFVACAVEATEALTIVLASGLTREWRSTFQGMAVALVVLAVVVAAVGPALTLVPLAGLRLVVGALLAIFGVQWLRKAILRATGHKSLHDEASAYLREVAAAKAATVTSRRSVNDWYAFTLSFKGVLLEGLEVVFIVITFGDSQRNLGAAVIGAAAAVIVITATGIAVRAPLARVPENACSGGPKAPVSPGRATMRPCSGSFPSSRSCRSATPSCCASGEPSPRRPSRIRPRHLRV
jgi:uncharacterized membrane protein